MCDAVSIGATTYAQNLMASKAQSSSAYQQQMVAYNNANANWEIDKRQADDRAKMQLANAILQMQQVQAAQQEANESASEQKSEIAREMMRDVPLPSYQPERRVSRGGQ